jgi:hypothetical protein
MIETEKNKDVSSSDSPPNEQRALPRVPGDTVGPLQVRADVLALSFTANVRDVSIQGIGLIAQMSFVLGTSFHIQAGPSGKQLPTELTAIVRHTAMLPDGRWLLGCVFSRHLTIDDFEVLG